MVRVDSVMVESMRVVEWKGRDCRVDSRRMEIIRAVEWKDGDYKGG